MRRGTLVGLTSVRATWLALLLAASVAAVAGAGPVPRHRATDEGAPPQGLRTVVIDPGHGGSETGAIGPNGTTEKAVVLDIARRLRDRIIRRLGLQVFLTRDGDIDVPLEHRTALANNHKADLFLSIHANAYRGTGIRGAETFFLSDRATDDESRRLAMLENDPLGLGEAAPEDTGLQLILWDLAQTLYLRESQTLAEMIQERLNHLAGTENRGIKQAPFRVLRGALMPAVLVEVGFLSNPEEERLLASPAYRQRIADALFDSLDEYRRRLGRLAGGAPRR